MIESLDESLVILVPVDEFLKQLFRARIVAGVSIRVCELAQRRTESEWVAGMPTKVDEHLQPFNFARISLCRSCKRLEELVLLPRFNHGFAEFAEQRQDIGCLSCFDHGIRHLVKLRKVRVPARELLSSAIDCLCRMARFKLQVDDEIRNLAARIGFRVSFKNLDRLVVLFERRENPALQKDRDWVGGVDFQRTIDEFLRFITLAALKQSLRIRKIRLGRFLFLAHDVIELGEPHLHARILRFHFQ